MFGVNDGLDVGLWISTLTNGNINIIVCLSSCCGKTIWHYRVEVFNTRALFVRPMDYGLDVITTYVLYLLCLCGMAPAQTERQ